MTEDEEKNRKLRCWSDVPEEIWSLIGSHIYGGGLLLFSKALCRSWESLQIVFGPLPPPVSIARAQSPCLVLFNPKIAHPIYNHHYELNVGEALGWDWDGYVMHNWLICCRPSRILFLNLLTNERIKLPRFFSSQYIIQSSYFTAPPTSPDCTVICVAEVPIVEFAVCIWRPGGDWMFHSFRYKRNFRLSDCNPVVQRGLIYFLGLKGNMLVFDPETNACRWAARSRPLGKRFRYHNCQSYLLVDDDELLAVHISLDGTWFRVFKLNHSKQDWELVQCLGDKMLFLSHHSSFVETATVRGAGNKIYLARFKDGKDIFYCLATGSYYYTDGSFCGKSLIGTKDYSRCAWIKPQALT